MKMFEHYTAVKHGQFRSLMALEPGLQQELEMFTSHHLRAIEGLSSFKSAR